VVAGESSEAGNPGTLGMTKRGGSLQGKGGCWMKGQLLNREFLDRIWTTLQLSLRDFSMEHTNPGLRPGLSSAVPTGPRWEMEFSRSL
jgi:hypothetical protein